jgi:hypothetical protein
MREEDFNNKQHNKNNTREMDFPLLPACLPQYGDDILAWKHLGAHPRNICQTLWRKAVLQFSVFLYLKYVNLLPSRICQLPFTQELWREQEWQSAKKRFQYLPT